MARHRYIIWDWNGTLFDDLTYSVGHINGMLERRGRTGISAERYRELFEFPVRRFYAHIGLDGESFEALSEEFIGHYEADRHTVGVHPQVRSVLEHVSQRGYGQSILSAYAHSTLVTLVEGLGLLELFEHLVGIDDIYADGKLAQGRRLLSRLPVAAQEVLLVGDTLHDAEVAQALGLNCALISHGHQSAERLAASGWPVFESLDDLHTFI